VEGRNQSLISGIISNFASQYAIKVQKIEELEMTGHSIFCSMLLMLICCAKKVTGAEVILCKFLFHQNSG
jgi:hypothetical protein